MVGVLGGITINGRADTVVKARPGERLRIRMLNTSNGRVYGPDFGSLDAKIIAVDGLYLRERVAATGFELAPGNRIDVDVRFDQSSAVPFEIIDRYFPHHRAADARRTREIRLGLWKIHILHHAASREVWGLWLLEELAEHGHDLSPGRLYPALARMEENGWLARRKSGKHPRARQLYRITPEGRALLRTLRREVTELYREVVLGEEPRSGDVRRK